MTTTSDSAIRNDESHGEHVVVKAISLPTGVTLEYAERGSARPGVPVLFLHGVTDSWRSFESVFPELPPDIHAYALSQRGHGDSSRPAAGYRYQDMADDLRAFMDAIQVPAAMVVGHSMGSLVAQRFVIDNPTRTAGLVLMCGWATLFGAREGPTAGEVIPRFRRLAFSFVPGVAPVNRPSRPSRFGLARRIEWRRWLLAKL